jgi:hypothetical protein
MFATYPSIRSRHCELERVAGTNFDDLAAESKSDCRPGGASKDAKHRSVVEVLPIVDDAEVELGVLAALFYTSTCPA